MTSAEEHVAPDVLAFASDSKNKLQVIAAIEAYLGDFPTAHMRISFGHDTAILEVLKIATVTRHSCSVSFAQHNNRILPFFDAYYDNVLQHAVKPRTVTPPTPSYVTVALTDATGAASAGAIPTKEQFLQAARSLKAFDDDVRQRSSNPYGARPYFHDQGLFTNREIAAAAWCVGAVMNAWDDFAVMVNGKRMLLLNAAPPRRKNMDIVVPFKLYARDNVKVPGPFRVVVPGYDGVRGVRAAFAAAEHVAPAAIQLVKDGRILADDAVLRNDDSVFVVIKDKAAPAEQVAYPESVPGVRVAKPRKPAAREQHHLGSRSHGSDSDDTCSKARIDALLRSPDTITRFTPSAATRLGVCMVDELITSLEQPQSKRALAIAKLLTDDGFAAAVGKPLAFPPAALPTLLHAMNYSGTTVLLKYLLPYWDLRTGTQWFTLFKAATEAHAGAAIKSLVVDTLPILEGALADRYTPDVLFLLSHLDDSPQWAHTRELREEEPVIALNDFVRGVMAADARLGDTPYENLSPQQRYVRTILNFLHLRARCLLCGMPITWGDKPSISCAMTDIGEVACASCARASRAFQTRKFFFGKVTPVEFAGIHRRVLRFQNKVDENDDSKHAEGEGEEEKEYKDDDYDAEVEIVENEPEVEFLADDNEVEFIDESALPSRYVYSDTGFDYFDDDDGDEVQDRVPLDEIRLNEETLSESEDEGGYSDEDVARGTRRRTQ